MAEIYKDRVQNWLQEEVFNRVAELDDFADRYDLLLSFVLEIRF